MLADTGLHLVKAIHNFKGTNNDELCFVKGDIITVTQSLEGGWWEGTLNGLTGWFPSNYVKEHKQDSLKVGKSPARQVEVPLSPKHENMKMYRGIVFKDIVDTENNHLNEIQSLLKNYLCPLQETDILSDKDICTLKSNIEEVCSCNMSFLAALESVKEKSSKEQRIGGVFMQMAPQIKKVNLIYCSNHPKAATVIELHKDTLGKFMEEHGASPPGIHTLTTGLSRPFRRLEKYPALLQELQRHTEENHIDRGDTQRAIFVFRDIASACLNVRRQKEMELEVMTGNIRGWEGEDIQTLGEIIHMGLVVFLTEDQEKKDRYLVMFSQNLVILSVSPRMSAFIYEGKLPLSGVTVKKLDSTDGFQYAFEITGNMIQRIIVICPSQEVLDQWLSILQRNIRASFVPSGIVPPKGSSHSSPSHVSQLHVTLSQASGTQLQQPQPLPPPHQTLSSSIPDGKQTPQGTRIATSHRPANKVWTTWSLRPHPPLRPSLSYGKGDVMLRRNNSRRKEKVPEEKNYEGDMRILQVIEAYCTSAKTRYTVNSACWLNTNLSVLAKKILDNTPGVMNKKNELTLYQYVPGMDCNNRMPQRLPKSIKALLDSPQMLIAEEEKIIVEELQGNSTIMEEKSLVDTVYALKDQVKELKIETSVLAKNLEEERRARKKLEILLKKHVFAGREELLTGIFEE